MSAFFSTIVSQLFLGACRSASRHPNIAGALGAIAAAGTIIAIGAGIVTSPNSERRLNQPNFDDREAIPDESDDENEVEDPQLNRIITSMDESSEIPDILLTPEGERRLWDPTIQERIDREADSALDSDNGIIHGEERLASLQRESRNATLNLYARTRSSKKRCLQSRQWQRR